MSTKPSANHFLTPSRDPNAMDIDATNTMVNPRHTDDEFHRMMRGRCYGCGSKNHRKADGHHERDICRYCGMTGHLETVCRRKFLGLPKKPGQQISASNSTLEEPPFSLTVSNEAPPTPSSPIPNDLTSVLQGLATNQQALAASIAALKSNF